MSPLNIFQSSLAGCSQLGDCVGLGGGKNEEKAPSLEKELHL